jgi:hypothetical protein
LLVGPAPSLSGPGLAVLLLKRFDAFVDALDFRLPGLCGVGVLGLTCAFQCGFMLLKFLLQLLHFLAQTFLFFAPLFVALS